MELLLDVDIRGGRLEGSVGRPTDSDRRTFSGQLELVACLEQLCPADSAGTADTAGTDEDGGPR